MEIHELEKLLEEAIEKGDKVFAMVLNTLIGAKMSGQEMQFAVYFNEVTKKLLEDAEHAVAQMKANRN